jgi:hypothetical protein
VAPIFCDVSIVFLRSEVSYVIVQAWLDSDHVVVGTKCNQLLSLSTLTGKVRIFSSGPPFASTSARTFSNRATMWSSVRECRVCRLT